eukprot:352932-Chlamydomonas_euryale.AAC.10
MHAPRASNPQTLDADVITSTSRVPRFQPALRGWPVGSHANNPTGERRAARGTDRGRQRHARMVAEGAAPGIRHQSSGGVLSARTR